MIREFEGRVAVVTGAASGIGAALAHACVERGMKIVAADIDAAGAEATAQRLGESAVAHTVDVADPHSVSALADASFARWGQVDLLFNNAGVFQGGLTWERSVEDWEWTLGVNVYGIIHGIRNFVPRMIAQETPGHVVNTASVAAFVGGPASGPYVVSKCAALSLSECLAWDLQAANSKIGASVLTPSAFDTEIAGTARVRPASFGTDSTPDGKATAETLSGMLADRGAPPEEIIPPVFEAIESGTFLIATKPSYRAQIQNRFDALMERKLPGLMEVD
ncbi:SDR family NAD(P)-dependent oxidoreductase [Myxococcota bacterium]|nr:SDR family NAD(P)-dependent oxidoreductase [Myxococcota bacterium]